MESSIGLGSTISGGGLRDRVHPRESFKPGDLVIVASSPSHARPSKGEVCVVLATIKADSFAHVEMWNALPHLMPRFLLEDALLLFRSDGVIDWGYVDLPAQNWKFVIAHG